MQSPRVTELTLTRAQLRQQVEDLARNVLQVSADEAIKRLETGEFEGTILEGKLSALLFLLG